MNYLDSLRVATLIVEAIAQLRPTEEIRCHEVARIVGLLLGLPIQDGKYGQVDHSWCWTNPVTISEGVQPCSPAGTAILDPYCVGRSPMVQLVAIHPFLPHLHGAYRLEPDRKDIDTEFVRTAVKRLEGSVAGWREVH